MAKCQDCKQEMLRVDGCTFPLLHWTSTDESIAFDYARIRNGQEKFGAFSVGRCHDCYVRSGNYHHLGCDVEECPRCGNQWISCECHEQGKFEVRR